MGPDPWQDAAPGIAAPARRGRKPCERSRQDGGAANLTERFPIGQPQGVGRAVRAALARLRAPP